MSVSIEDLDIMIEDLYRRIDNAWSVREKEECEQEVQLLREKQSRLWKRERR